MEVRMVQLTEEKMAHIKELRKKAMKLPLHPGVYIMHSRDDTIICPPFSVSILIFVLICLALSIARRRLLDSEDSL